MEFVIGLFLLTAALEISDLVSSYKKGEDIFYDDEDSFE